MEIDKISRLLKSIEEIKAIITPLIEHDENALIILNKHEEALNFLLEDSIGNIEDHKYFKNKLELLQIKIDDVAQILIEKENIYESVDETSASDDEINEYREIYKKTKLNNITDDDLSKINEFIVKYPTNPFLLGIKSRILYILDRKEESIDYINDSIEKFSDNDWLLFIKSNLLNPDTQSGEIIELLNRCLSILSMDNKNNRHIVLHHRALIYANSGNLEQSLKDINQSIMLISDCPTSWSLKSFLEYKLDKISDSMGSIEKALELNNDFSFNWNMKGVILLSLGEKYYEDSITSFNKAIELDNENIYAHYNKTTVLSFLDKYTEALESINNFISIVDDNPCAYCKKAVILNHLDRNEEAESFINKAISIDSSKKIDKDCLQIFVNAAIISMRNNNYTKAKDIIEDVLKKDTNNEAANELLEQINEYLKR